MNLLLLNENDFIDTDHAAIDGRRAEHALSILKTAPGGTIRTGIVDGNIGTSTVTDINNGRITMAVSCHEPPPPPLPVTLICAMQRPKTFRKLLQCGAAMGVKKFIVIECWKVDKSYWDSPVLKPESLREQFLLGLEQGRDTVMPELEIRRRFRPFAEDELPGLAAGRLALVAHPDGDIRCPTGIDRETLLAIGPEGGFTDYEVGKFKDTGFTPINMGPRIMRTEFALAALLGKIF